MIREYSENKDTREHSENTIEVPITASDALRLPEENSWKLLI